MIPAPHQDFVDRAIRSFSGDARFLGLAAAGSWISGTLDEHSDLVAVVREEALAEVMAERLALMDRLGPLLVAFTGEHD